MYEKQNHRFIWFFAHLFVPLASPKVLPLGKAKKNTFFLLLLSISPTFPSFSLAQRKEAKETSTYPHPLPIWRGSTENCGYRQFSDFSAVKSGIKARFCFFFGLRQVVGANHHSPLSPLSPLSPSSPLTYRNNVTP